MRYPLLWVSLLGVLTCNLALWLPVGFGHPLPVAAQVGVAMWNWLFAWIFGSEVAHVQADRRRERR